MLTLILIPTLTISIITCHNYNKWVIQKLINTITITVVLTRETPELFSSLDDEEVLEDLGYNADLYIFNQNDVLD